MNKKLALLLLVPLLTPLFLVVPTTRATGPFLMEMYVYCYNDGTPQGAYASLRVQGHTLQVTCPAGTGYTELYKTACFVTTTAQTKIFAETKIGPTVQVTNGRWTPGNYMSHSQYGADSEAYWHLEDCTE
jgi:hypothetical protein